jgi:hypothetical protein
MSVPNHSPDCYTKTYPTSCPYCGQEVFFFACSCGSKIFFDGLGDPWPQHHCPEYELKSVIQKINEAGTSTDDEIYSIVREYSVKNNKPIPDELNNILDKELSKRNKPFKCTNVLFNEKIEGISGQVFAMNSSVNFTNRMHFGPNPDIAKGLLGELSKSSFTEIIIRDKPDNNNHSRQYSVFIETNKLRVENIRLTDLITVRVRASKSYEKVWIISSVQKL